jgi:hypothetical protein
MNTEYDMTALTTNEKKKAATKAPKEKAPPAPKSNELTQLTARLRVLNLNTQSNRRMIDDHHKASIARTRIVTDKIRILDQSIDARARKQVELKLKRIDELKDVNKLIKSIDGLQARVDELSNRVWFMVHKETILTEVSRFARDKGDWMQLAQFHLAIMRAFNQDNEWWGANEHESLIGEWYVKIMALLEEQTNG